jgi:hypothetical protein
MGLHDLLAIPKGKRRFISAIFSSKHSSAPKAVPPPESVVGDSTEPTASQGSVTIVNERCQPPSETTDMTRTPSANTHGTLPLHGAQEYGTILGESC